MTGARRQQRCSAYIVGDLEISIISEYLRLCPDYIKVLNDGRIYRKCGLNTL